MFICWRGPAKADMAPPAATASRKFCSENLASYVIQSDADLSHPPELLPRMIELLKTNPVVIGSRYVAGGGAENWDIRRRCS